MPSVVLNSTVVTTTYNSLDAGVFSVIVIIAFACAIILLVLGSFSRYKKFRGFIGWLGKCFYYFGEGMIVVTFFGSISLVAYLFGKGVEQGTIRLDIIAVWAAGVIGGFFAIAGIGYLFDKIIWKRIKEFGKKYKEEVKDSG